MDAAFAVPSRLARPECMMKQPVELSCFTILHSHGLSMKLAVQAEKNLSID